MKKLCSVQNENVFCVSEIGFRFNQKLPKIVEFSGVFKAKSVRRAVRP
ncbi:MAG: hypothetical protein U5M51_15700 [Emticicia sp.]|nr:hypothetical protein [Emticicia sp.]